MKFRISLFTFTLLAFQSFGQSSVNLFDFTETADVKVTIGSDSLVNPWAGGINYGQVNTIDLNLDGTHDLVVFDRNTRRVTTYVAHPSGSSVTFKYAPEYRSKFPIPYTWMIIEDYNCDGKKDIFYNTRSNAMVLENTSDSDLSFTDPLGHSIKEIINGGNSELFISSEDMPAITDVDNDGDLDIFTFTNQGTVTEFHENRLNCGLNYRLKEYCWGHFSESGLWRSVALGDCLPFKKKTMHSGSSMLLLDLNDDGVKDLLLGNIEFPDITALYNTGTPDSAYFASQDTLFPRYDKAIEVDLFPTLSYTDLTNDGVSDLIASPYLNADGFANQNSLHLYTNTGTETAPVFNFSKSDFMQDGMIDMGQGAVPRLVDLTGDGLLDLVISNEGEYDPSTGQLEHYYHYYKNTGTATDPEFALVDNDFLNISSYGIGNGSIPAFGDLDGDGDQDLIIGDENGQLHYFTNGSSSDPDFALHTAGLQGGSGMIDVGNNAAPFLFDMDNDGALDLVVGNYNGRLHYYINNSTSSPDFTLSSDYYGTVNTWRRNASSGKSIPYVFENDSIINMFVGSAGEGIIHYDSISSVNKLPGMLTGTIGTDTLISNTFEESPFGISKKNGRNQFLIKASELKAQNLSFGNITELAFKVTTANNSTVYGVNISIKSVSDTVLTGFATDMTTVRSREFFPTTNLGQGWNFLPFEEPYFWDGESSLIIEVCFSGQPTPNMYAPYYIQVEMSDVGFDSHAYGDYVNPTLGANGCNQPFKNIIQKRPNVKLDIVPAFVETNNYFNELRNLAPAIADLDGDGYVDMIMGNHGGGLNYYKGKEYTVSISEEPIIAKEESIFEIFPNPSGGVFNLEVPNQSEASLQVFDLTGKLILSKTIDSKTSTVDLSGRARGIYLFILNAGQKVSTQKVILE